MNYILSFLFLIICSFVYSDDFGLNLDEPHLVHFQEGRNFSVEFFEFIGRQNDVQPNGTFKKEEVQWIKDRPRYGDSVLIKEIAIEHLPGGSYRYIALLKNLRNDVEEYFQTRVVNPSNKIKVAKDLGFKSRKGWKDKIIELEDGEVFNVAVTEQEERDEKAAKYFTFEPGDELEMKEFPLYSYRNYQSGQTQYFEIKVYRDGVALPFEVYSSDKFSRKPFPNPTNNRFYATQRYGYIYLSGMESKRGYEILSPKDYKKTDIWWTFSYAEDDILTFVDEDGIEIKFRPRPEPPLFTGPIRM